MRCQYVLARRLQDRLSEIYATERKAIYQRTLFEADAAPNLSFENGFKFFDGMFDGVRTYQGRTTFAKHFTGKNQVPAFDGKGEDGEEFQCAMFLDANNRVKHWIRNVAKHPNAFWLPLAGGRFYPDFIAELVDGTIFVVEYKGEHLLTNADTKAKMSVGVLWEKVSAGKGLFLLALKSNEGVNMRDQLVDKLA
jgi:type III restriction enzyme